jgi:hypothetical protein
MRDLCDNMLISDIHRIDSVNALSGKEAKMFIGVGGVIAAVVIVVVCAIVFTIAIRREMN